MSPIGDSFPASYREQFAKDNLVPGSVIRCFVNDVTPPKEKYFVIIGTTSDKVLVGSIYINSVINPNRFNTAYLKSLHLPVLQADYSFLDHDSYIDCSEIYPKEYSIIAQQIKEDNGLVKGNLTPSDLNKVLSVIKGAATISTTVKKQFGIST